MPLEDIPPGAFGRVELRGAAWSAAKNVATLARGQRCTVRRVDGLKLYVLPEGARYEVASSRCCSSPFLVLIVVAKTAIVVPQQSAYVVERLGRYSGTLDAGFHILIPFIDVIRYKHSLKEAAVDIPAQVCITRDNVQVRRRRRPVYEGAQPGARLLRHLRLQLRHLAAGADDAAQRSRQDRARSHVRRAHQHQHAGGQGAGQGDRAVGREGAALRDQEHHAAAGRAGRDGKADARRARKARGDSDVGRHARRGDQHRGRRRSRK